MALAHFEVVNMVVGLVERGGWNDPDRPDLKRPLDTIQLLDQASIITTIPLPRIPQNEQGSSLVGLRQHHGNDRSRPD